VGGRGGARAADDAPAGKEGGRERGREGSAFAGPLFLSDGGRDGGTMVGGRGGTRATHDAAAGREGGREGGKEGGKKGRKEGEPFITFFNT